jgi:hypothetical protein
MLFDVQISFNVCKIWRDPSTYNLYVYAFLKLLYVRIGVLVEKHSRVPEYMGRRFDLNLNPLMSFAWDVNQRAVYQVIYTGHIIIITYDYCCCYNYI